MALFVLVPPPPLAVEMVRSLSYALSCAYGPRFMSREKPKRLANLRPSKGCSILTIFDCESGLPDQVNQDAQTRVRKENQLKQKKKDEEAKAQAVRRVCVSLL